MMLGLARPKIAPEIERKFLVRELPANLKDCQSRPMQQGYFAVKRDGTQVRLRKTRYDVPCEEHLIEVDIYGGNNKGLVNVRLARE